MLKFYFKPQISGVKYNLSKNKPYYMLICAQQAYLRNKHAKSKLSQFKFFPDFPDVHQVGSIRKKQNCLVRLHMPWSSF